MSQQIIRSHSHATGNKKRKIDEQIERSHSQPDPYTYLDEEGQMIADSKIEKLEQFLQSLREHIPSEDEYITNSISFSQSQQQEQTVTQVLFLSYFIGRCNPPHNGHIFALTRLLNDVISGKGKGTEAKALILLGSGPKKQRTGDNPIPFDLKSRFIKYKVKQELGITDAQLDSICQIQEMNNAFTDVPRFVREQIEGKDIDSVSSIRITHYAGDKDGDASKLVGVGERSEATAIHLTDGSTPVTRVTESLAPMASGTEVMSATKVRKDAYEKLTREQWFSKYGEFYGEFSEEMYREIKQFVGVKLEKGGKTRRKRKKLKKRKTTKY
jgi:hypothetical protein